MLPNVVRCMLRNPYSPKCVEEEFSEVRLVQLSKNTRVGDAYPSLLYYGALIISRSRLGMRIAVIGAGGTGGYFGGLLAQAGEEVTFIARGAQLEALHRRGLTLESRLAGTFTIPVRATDDPSEIGPVDLVLFCVKTYDTDTAAQSIRPLIGPDTMLLSLQNGIDNEERIARVAGHTSGIGAVAYVTSVIKAPGVIAQTSGPGKIILGELSGGASARTERLHNVLQRAGITAEVHPDIRVVLWQKFLFICAFSGVTAVSRLPIGTILVDPETHALFQGMSEEVEAVARASGIDLPADCVEQALAIAAAAEPGAHGSLYHDLAVGRRLELESLNGEVVRRGREHGIETPLNFAIYATLRPYVNGPPILP
jgi:2-dehydropantoate 2-reductase